MTDLPSLLATLRDMRALSGDPLVVRVCDDAAEVIEKQGGDRMRDHQLGKNPYIDEITAEIERDVQARVTAVVERDMQAIADRARRRDLFAAAALQGLLASGRVYVDMAEFGAAVVRHTEAALAALDAAAGPTSVEVPPAPQSRPAETQRP